MDERGRGEGRRLLRPQAATGTSSARSVVVVCCNGVGTPRLLLASRSRLFPDGLANEAATSAGT